MEVTYKNNKIRKICTDAKTAERAYGREMADKIHQRIDELHAADTVEMMIQWHIGRCHPLTQNRKGQYAMDLIITSDCNDKSRRRHYGEKSQLHCNATRSDN